MSRRPAESLPPSFFIVGAPRCGTTSLSRALRRHPQISFSKPKETHFLLLAPDELPDAELRGLYVDLHHPDLGPGHKAIGDGSVSYLYVPDTIRRALRFDRRAKFIAMVRSPLEMLPSYHARMVFNLDEDVSDFAQAWELQSRRAAGEKIPKRCRDPRLLQYGEVGKLGTHVEQLFAVAGRERCLVIPFDDLDHDPRAVYQRVLAFIGVDYDGQTKLSRKAQTRGFKSAWLQRFVMNPPSWVLPLIDVANSSMTRRLRRVRQRIKKVNTFRQERPECPPVMAQKLRDFFADDVDRLGALLDRDLSHWLE